VEEDRHGILYGNGFDIFKGFFNGIGSLNLSLNIFIDWVCVAAFAL
jgi:hypothetical protein